MATSLVQAAAGEPDSLPVVTQRQENTTPAIRGPVILPARQPTDVPRRSDLASEAWWAACLSTGAFFSSTIPLLLIGFHNHVRY